MADVRPGFENVAALDPGQAVAPFPDPQVLGLGALIEGRSTHGSVAAPAEIGERSCNAGTMAGIFKAGDARLLVEIRALQEGLQVNHIRQVAETRFVND